MFRVLQRHGSGDLGEKDKVSIASLSDAFMDTVNFFPFFIHTLSVLFARFSPSLTYRKRKKKISEGK